jgi:hypothetical protein
MSAKGFPAGTRGADQASLAIRQWAFDVMSPITVLVWKVGEMFLGPGPMSGEDR